MERLTNNQIAYRAYLASDLWKQKRLEALSFYGCVCNRCGEHGTDVHHKTYERVGGGELMEDFEILCRDCHEAHHKALRCSKPRRGTRKGIHRRAIYSCLKKKHLKILSSEFPNERYVNSAISYGNPEMAYRAARLLGFDYIYGTPKQKTEKNPKFPPRPPSFKKPEVHPGQGFKLDESKTLWKKLASL